MKMNVDAILKSFADHAVDAILIGGMNYLLRHQPVLTYDVDFWVKDTDENLARVAAALRELGASWGRDEASWKPVPDGFEWLHAQPVFCLSSAQGAIDIFRDLAGLEGQYEACRARATVCQTASGISYVSLADQDMIACQLALPEGLRRLDRVAYLENILKRR